MKGARAMMIKQDFNPDLVGKEPVPVIEIPKPVIKEEPVPVIEIPKPVIKEEPK
jgi:hypothetical protein